MRFRSLRARARKFSVWTKLCKTLVADRPTQQLLSDSQAESVTQPTSGSRALSGRAQSLARSLAFFIGALVGLDPALASVVRACKRIGAVVVVECTALQMIFVLPLSE